MILFMRDQGAAGLKPRAEPTTSSPGPRTTPDKDRPSEAATARMGTGTMGSADSRRVAIRGGEVAGGRWEVAQRRPHPALAEVVLGYLGYDERLAGPVRRRELPAARVTLIVNLGPPLRVEHPLGTATLVPSGGGFASGLHERYAVSETDGAQRGVEVLLDPLGVGRVLGWPAAELAGRVVDLGDLLGPAAGELAERLAESPDWAGCFAFVNRLFRARLDRRPAAVPSPVVAAAWGRLRGTGGEVAIGALAAELGCSRGHLSARFREEVGVGPKAVARLLRFRRAVAALDGGGRPSMAALAADCGYYDQAHFGNEFARFSGASPAAYLRRRLGAGGLDAGAADFASAPDQTWGT